MERREFLEGAAASSAWAMMLSLGLGGARAAQAASHEAGQAAGGATAAALEELRDVTREIEASFPSKWWALRGPDDEAEARRFVEEGARVVMGDLLVEEGEAVAAELGDAAVFVRHDVTSADDWTAVVAAAEAFGGVDILVNNAGVHWARPLEHENVDDFRRMLDINLVGAFLGMQAVIAPMPAMNCRASGVK